MKRIFFLLVIPSFITGCGCENRYKEPGFVRNDTIYDMTYVLNQRVMDPHFEQVAQKADIKFCIDSSKIDPNIICAEVYEPVCGCDGRVYANACKAESQGVLRYAKGECED